MEATHSKQQPRRRTSGREEQYRRHRRLGWLFSVAVALLTVFVLFYLWLIPAKINGASMEPALTEGETVLIDRLARYWKLPARGDMILFETEDGRFIKRIVGLPGETVEVIGGRVYIDSRPLDERAYMQNPVGDAAAVTVPEGSVYVLGDNRAQAYDSRLDTVGCIAYADIVGVLRVRVAPITRLTLFF